MILTTNTVLPVICDLFQQKLEMEYQFIMMRIAASGAESQGKSFAFGTLNSSGTYTNSANFTPMIGVNNGNKAGTGARFWYFYR